jgi:curved DNA-binding protein CbpA
MNNSLKNINFEDLEFNLYELLNVKKDADKRKIKKSYKKLIIQFHPDKCSELEENIFYNITLAYQILKNDELRKKYDSWLIKPQLEKNQIELKKYFLKESNNIKSYFPNLPQEAKINYDKKVKDLEKKHGIIENDNTPIKDKYNFKVSDRHKMRKVKKEEFRNKIQFNDKFINRKKNTFKNVTQNKKKDIICYEMTQISKQYATVKDYDKLYSNETVQNDEFSSLDKAYMMHPEIFYDKSASSKKKLKKYKKQTKKLQNLNFKLNEN